jgi:hypothetical protein
MRLSFTALHDAQAQSDLHRNHPRQTTRGACRLVGRKRAPAMAVKGKQVERWPKLKERLQ